MLAAVQSLISRERYPEISGYSYGHNFSVRLDSDVVGVLCGSTGVHVLLDRSLHDAPNSGTGQLI